MSALAQLTAALCVAAHLGCSSHVEQASGGAAAEGTGSGGAIHAASGGRAQIPGEGSGAVAAAGGAGGEPSSCIAGDTQCSDCVDNDADGSVDAADSECLAAHDNDEGSFRLGIHHRFDDYCKNDCFFDADSGSGNDGCEWSGKCDPLSPLLKCPYDPSYAYCPSITQKCVDSCLWRTPNGCDCFGCCSMPLADGSSVDVLLAGSCSEETLLDPTSCGPCTKKPACDNPCDACELCVGKKGLAPTCNGFASPCAGGAAACTIESPCPPGTWCQTGCCIPVR